MGDLIHWRSSGLRPNSSARRIEAAVPKSPGGILRCKFSILLIRLSTQRPLQARSNRLTPHQFRPRDGESPLHAYEDSYHYKGNSCT